MAGRQPRHPASVADVTEPKATTGAEDLSPVELEVMADGIGLDSPDGATEATPGDASTLGKGGLFNLLGSLSYALLNFAVIAMVTRNMGKDGSGQFFIAIAAFSILARSSMIGADVGLVRFVSRYRALDRRGSLRPTLLVAVVPVAVVGGLAGLATFAFAETLGRLFAEDPTDAGAVADYLRILAPFIPISAVYQTLDGGARGFATMVPTLVVEKITRPLVTLALLIAVFAAGLDTDGGAGHWVGFGWSVPWAVALVPTALWVHRLLTRAERRVATDRRAAPPTSALARTFWRFTAPRSLGAMLQVALLWADTLLIGRLDSSESASIYAASTRWLIVGQFAGMAISTAFAPQISSLLSLDVKGRAHDLFETATSWLVLLAWPAYLTVMIFGSTLVRTFGAGYGEGAEVLAIVGGAFLFATATGPVDVVLLMGGKSKLSLLNNVVALVVNIGLNLALIPSMGLRGAAIAWGASLLISNLLPLIQVWRTIGIQPIGPRWSLAVGAALLAVGLPEVVLRLVLGPSVPAMALAVLVSGTLYVGVLWTCRERLELASLVAGLRRRSRRSPA